MIRYPNSGLISFLPFSIFYSPESPIFNHTIQFRVELDIFLPQELHSRISEERETRSTGSSRTFQTSITKKKRKMIRSLSVVAQSTRRKTTNEGELRVGSGKSPESFICRLNSTSRGNPIPSVGEKFQQRLRVVGVLRVSPQSSYSPISLH